jgi:hypothetical protein
MRSRARRPLPTAADVNGACLVVALCPGCGNPVDALAHYPGARPARASRYVPPRLALTDGFFADNSPQDRRIQMITGGVPDPAVTQRPGLVQVNDRWRGPCKCGVVFDISDTTLLRLVVDAGEHGAGDFYLPRLRPAR